MKKSISFLLVLVLIFSVTLSGCTKQNETTLTGKDTDV